MDTSLASLPERVHEIKFSANDIFHRFHAFFFDISCCIQHLQYALAWPNNDDLFLCMLFDISSFYFVGKHLRNEDSSSTWKCVLTLGQMTPFSDFES